MPSDDGYLQQIARSVRESKAFSAMEKRKHPMDFQTYRYCCSRTRQLLFCQRIQIQLKEISNENYGVIVLNNARGGLIVEADLASALHSGKIYAAGLDVVSTEPIQSDSPLLAAPNCIITPHISWAPKECRQRIMDMTADNIQHFISSAPIHVVNR